MTDKERLDYLELLVSQMADQDHPQFTPRTWEINKTGIALGSFPEVTTLVICNGNRLNPGFKTLREAIDAFKAV